MVLLCPVCVVMWLKTIVASGDLGFDKRFTGCHGLSAVMDYPK